MNKIFVAILMGSDKDYDTMAECFKTLNQFNITFEARVLSAHRTPEQTLHYVQDAQKRGCAVFIAAAGMAAHLAGTIAAHTIKPVIGVPINASLNGLDALLATVQMPAGVPVACTSIGKAGAQNAAFLAAQILALSDESLTKKIHEIRQQKQKEIEKANQILQEKISENV